MIPLTYVLASVMLLSFADEKAVEVAPRGPDVSSLEGDGVWVAKKKKRQFFIFSLGGALVL